MANHEKEFYTGQPNWQIRNSEEQDISPEAWAYTKENKFLGLAIPEERGGLGLGA